MFKRLWAVLLAVLLLLSTAHAASIAVDFADTAALIDAEGTEIVAPGTYSFIFALDADGTLFCGGSEVNGTYRYALLDGAGNRLTEQAYDCLLYTSRCV